MMEIHECPDLALDFTASAEAGDVFGLDRRRMAVSVFANGEGVPCVAVVTVHDALRGKIEQRTLRGSPPVGDEMLKVTGGEIGSVYPPFDVDLPFGDDTDEVFCSMAQSVPMKGPATLPYEKDLCVGKRLEPSTYRCMDCSAATAGRKIRLVRGSAVEFDWPVRWAVAWFAAGSQHSEAYKLPGLYPACALDLGGSMLAWVRMRRREADPTEPFKSRWRLAKFGYRRGPACLFELLQHAAQSGIGMKAGSPLEVERQLAH